MLLQTHQINTKMFANAMSILMLVETNQFQTLGFIQ
jgi:hypothetical protein